MSRVVRPLAALAMLALATVPAAAQSPEQSAPGTSVATATNTEAELSPASAPDVTSPAATSAAAMPQLEQSTTAAPPSAGAGASAPLAPPTSSSASTTPASPPIIAPLIEPVQQAAPARATAPASEPPRFALDMAAAISRLGSRAEARDRTTLQAFYAARQGAPVWVAQTGRHAAGDNAVAELQKAASFGLDQAAILGASLSGTAKPGQNPDQLALEEAELSAAVLRYARHARGGRLDPQSITKFLDRKPTIYEGRSVLDQIATTSEPGAYLRDLNPQHPQFVALRKKYLETLRNPQSVVSVAPQAAPEKERKKGAKNAAAAAPPGGVVSARRLLSNMEQWRWMPPDLGDFYVWVNIPEYTLRVVSKGQVIHTERVIVGKLDTQTPIFSHRMEQVIFHPFWGVPDSIKQNEVLPSLRGNGAVLAKHNLRIQIGGKDVDPRSVDWSKTDIRKAHVYQPPGGDNVLGVVKFRFPNKHDVYMHDTPTKNLFSQTVRMYSHGCMRVQNPVRLAELILAEDRRMSSEQVRALATKGAPENNQLNLARKVPVHMTYFTVAADEEGKVRTFADIYGHEERIALALEGKAHLIQPVPEPKGPQPAQPVASLNDSWFSGWSGSGGGGSYGKSSKGGGDWARRAFGNN